MKKFDIRHLILYPREFPVDGLERAYLEFKNSPPDAVAFSDDNGNQLFRWEDVEILHFLPRHDSKVKYYWIMHFRDQVLSEERFASSVADDISHFLHWQDPFCDKN